MVDAVNSQAYIKDKNDTPNNPLAKKLSKLLETRIENDSETVEALKGLSQFFNENSLRARRNLRSDIEKRSVLINERFLHSFHLVKESLDTFHADVVSMSSCCDDMSKRLRSVRMQTNDLISQTNKLKTETQRIQLQQSVVSSFLEAFQLKPEELKALRGNRDGSLDKNFFSALERAKKIHDDCKVLLRTNQQTAGLEIMDSMAFHQENAFKNLYKWAQNESRSLTADNPDIAADLCTAMSALQVRPVLLKCTVGEFATARRATVVRAFLHALTRGGPGGTPRPMELHSHDPLRYTGDMLAWMHQASASEKEHLQHLFKQCEASTIEEYMIPTLGHVMEGVCRPLKVRIEQVFVTETSTVTLYQLANLLKFYHSTIGQILASTDLAFLETLEELRTLGRQMFLNSLSCQMAKLVEKPDLPPQDLGPTESVLQVLSLLKSILSCQDSTIVAAGDKQRDFGQIMSYIVDPLVNACSVAATRLTSTDMAVFLVNCVHHIQTTLAFYQYTDERLEMLQAQVDAHLDTLVSEQVTGILHQTGLAAIYELSQKPMVEPLGQQPGADLLAIKALKGKFDNFLSATDDFIMPQQALLQSANLREKVRQRSLQMVCHVYEQAYKTLNDHELMPRTPEQVKKLLI